DLRPSVSEIQTQVQPGYSDGRLLAREIMMTRGIRGEIGLIQPTSSGFHVRITVPGTVHEIGYDRESGSTVVRSNTAGVIGMLNRLHHAAGLWHEYLPLKTWAVLVGIVSCATVGLACTGLWMWWLRRQERTWGLILLVANLAVSVVLLA